MSRFMEEAREFAAQCWCDEETQGITMDPRLAEAVARRISVWMDTARMHAENEDYYRGIVDKCVDNLGPLKAAAHTRNDGTLSESPLRCLVPSCVGELTTRLRQAETCVEAMRLSKEEASKPIGIFARLKNWIAFNY